MAKYDPFTRGPHPVGVRSESWLDSARNRELPVEIWYPATSNYTGADTDPARQDTFPAVWTAGDDTTPPPMRQAAVRDATPAALPGRFVLFTHGYAGHRREGTYLCTHLASHGYVVASADHMGYTSWEVDARMNSGDPVDMSAQRHEMGVHRLGDVPFMVAEATKRGYATSGPVGVVGVSLGGFTAMIAPAVEPRVKVTIPLCPAGARARSTHETTNSSVCSISTTGRATPHVFTEWPTAIRGYPSMANSRCSVKSRRTSAWSFFRMLITTTSATTSMLPTRGSRTSPWRMSTTWEPTTPIGRPSPEPFARSKNSRRPKRPTRCGEVFRLRSSTRF